MKGPRIIVFHIRQLLKTAAFVAAGLLIIILLIWVLSPGRGDAQSMARARTTPTPTVGGSLHVEDPFAHVLFVPGSYSTAIILDEQALYITVDVNAFAITDVRITRMAEAHQYRFPLFAPVLSTLRHDILLNQTTDVALPELWPQTGLILLEAINIALSQAYIDPIVTLGL